MAKAKKSYSIRIYNTSNQTISLQARAPGSDFFTGEQQIRISSGKDVLLPKNYLRMDQIENLQRRGMIKILFDGETVEEQKLITS